MRYILALLLLCASICPQEPSGGVTVSPSGGTTVTFATGKTCGGSTGCSWVGTTPSAGQAQIVSAWGSTTLTITGSNVSDGMGSVFTCNTVYLNATNFASVTCYTCNSVGGGNITLSPTLGTTSYVAGIAAAGNSSTGCIDAYNKNQSTSNGTALSCTALATTTNTHDLLVGLMTNNTAASTYTAGTDSQGNTMAIQQNTSQVAMIETFNETTLAAFNPLATYGAGAKWNDECMAIK